jgi:hypothetical protein
MNAKRYWFKRRRLGIGWTPSTWEGWAASAGFVLVQAALPALLERLVDCDAGTIRKVRLAGGAAFAALMLSTGEPLW